jgi:hypothetical protein
MTALWLTVAGLLSQSAVTVDHVQQQIPPEAYLDPVDQEIARTGTPTGNRTAPCEILKSQHYEDGILHQQVEWLPTEKCVKMDAPKHWHGLWRNEFEGSQFCPGEPADCTYEVGPRIWFSWRGKFPNALKPRISGVYEIEFVGRKTSYSGTYGHFGLFDDEIIADRIISIHEIPELEKE